MSQRWGFVLLFLGSVVGFGGWVVLLVGGRDLPRRGRRKAAPLFVLSLVVLSGALYLLLAGA